MPWRAISPWAPAGAALAVDPIAVRNRDECALHECEGDDMAFRTSQTIDNDEVKACLERVG
jgi:hypothetical protein